MNARTLFFIGVATVLGVGLVAGSGAAADVTPSEADIVVGDSSAANATTIQEGVNQAPSGGTVYVESGLYAGNVTVTDPVRIVGPNATIAGSGPTDGGAGVVAQAPTAIEGLAIGATQAAVVVDTSGTVRIDDLLAGDTRVAVEGTNATGPVVVENSELRATDDGIARTYPAGHLAVKNTTIDSEGRGIDVAMSSGRSAGAPSTATTAATVSIRNSTVVANGSAVGVRADSLNVETVRVYSPADGLTTIAGTASLTDLTVDTRGYGVAAWTANGASLTSSDVTAESVGVGLNGANASIEATAIDAGTDGVVAESTNASVKRVSVTAGRDGLALSNGVFSASRAGIRANRTAVNASRAALDASDLSLEAWRGVHAMGHVQVGIDHSDVTATRAALAVPASGSVSVSRSWLSTGSAPTVRSASGASIDIEASEFATTDRVVEASGRTTAINTTGSWWGQAGGPTAADVSGPVESAAPADTPIAPTAVADRALPVEPIDGTVPRDDDFDGVFEDLSADGTINFPDVNTYFQHTEDRVITAFVTYFDIDGDGAAGLQDVLALFETV
ncbi:hypothetical protein [Halococcoides cellulosivorans]|uniref:Uncharacterized protein n=1 Tax=Halococcoides cellulosivorans TaxID=1679096 RepID=A0A2R4WYA3_9EURY|nr:hypothetical protein [Halococcoides cellulosivorans]AWB26529.1 hypothetical protein HARCEL1_01775 [Halococcoides cellulosivorans]